jgi:hypothetical protein
VPVTPDPRLRELDRLDADVNTAQNCGVACHQTGDSVSNVTCVDRVVKRLHLLPFVFFQVFNRLEVLAQNLNVPSLPCLLDVLIFYKLLETTRIVFLELPLVLELLLLESLHNLFAFAFIFDTLSEPARSVVQLVHVCKELGTLMK